MNAMSNLTTKTVTVAAAAVALGGLLALPAMASTGSASHDNGQSVSQPDRPGHDTASRDHGVRDRSAREHGSRDRSKDSSKDSTNNASPDRTGKDARSAGR
jgi:hypothetical protein